MNRSTASAPGSTSRYNHAGTIRDGFLFSYFNGIKAKKDTILVVLIFLSCVATVQARNKISLLVGGGYSLPGMVAANRNLQFLADIMETKLKRIDEGKEVNMEALYHLTSRLAIGPRIEYVVSNKGQIVSQVTVPVFDANGQRIGIFPRNIELTQDVSMASLMFGGRYSVVQKEKWFLEGGAFFGWGIAEASMGERNELILPDQCILYSKVTRMQNSNITGEVLVGGTYMVFPAVFLGIDMGYRQAVFTEMKFINGPYKGETQEFFTGKSEYDFSSIFTSLSVRYVF